MCPCNPSAGEVESGDCQNFLVCQPVLTGKLQAPVKDPVSKNGMDGSLGQCLASICSHTFVHLHDPPLAHTNTHEIEERKKTKESVRECQDLP